MGTLCCVQVFYFLPEGVAPFISDFFFLSLITWYQRDVLYPRAYSSSSSFSLAAGAQSVLDYGALGVATFACWASRLGMALSHGVKVKAEPLGTSLL